MIFQTLLGKSQSYYSYKTSKTIWIAFGKSFIIISRKML